MFNPMAPALAVPEAPVNPPTLPELSAPAGQVAPSVPSAAPAPMAIPPMKLVISKQKKKEWDAEIVRRAQSIYPAEAQAKAANMAAAKIPTPAGAWGKPV